MVYLGFFVSLLPCQLCIFGHELGLVLYAAVGQFGHTKHACERTVEPAIAGHLFSSDGRFITGFSLYALGFGYVAICDTHG
jgi:hypothetical protein